MQCSHKEEQVQVRKLVTAVIVATGIAMSIVSAQEVSQEDYDSAIDELRFILTDTAMHIDASYFGDLGEDSDKLYDQFTTLDTFWKAQDQAKALEITKAAFEAISGISRASGAQDGPAATAALTELRARFDNIRDPECLNKPVGTAC